MKIAIGGDHAGYDYKVSIKSYLENLGHEVKDFGPYSDDSADYPDFVHPLSTAVEEKECDLGILICGSGNGVAITANKHQGIRAALCWQVELAALARQHNDANVLCMASRFTELDLVKEMAKTFLDTQFEGGRHTRRVSKISC